MAKRQKTYQDGVRESIEILQALKDVDERERHAYFMVSKFIEDKDDYCDKAGTKIKEGDFMKVNPTDDDWLDLVIRYTGNLIFVSELTDREPVRLKDVLQGSHNPAIVVGNLHESRIEFYKW